MAQDLCLKIFPQTFKTATPKTHTHTHTHARTHTHRSDMQNVGKQTKRTKKWGGETGSEGKELYG